MTLRKLKLVQKPPLQRILDRRIHRPRKITIPRQHIIQANPLFILAKQLSSILVAVEIALDGARPAVEDVGEAPVAAPGLRGPEVEVGGEIGEV